MGACASKPKVKSEDAPSRAPAHTSSARSRVARSLINPLAGSPACKQATQPATAADSAAATPEKEAVVESGDAISRADEQGSKRRSLKILFKENEDDMDSAENFNALSESAKQEPTHPEKPQERSDLELESLKPEPVKTHEKSTKEPETRMEVGTTSYTKKQEPVETIVPTKETEMKLLESEIKLLESKAKMLSETAKREMISLPPDISPMPSMPPEDTDTKLLEFVDPPETEKSTIEPEIKFPELEVKEVPRQPEKSEPEPKPKPEPEPPETKSKNKSPSILEIPEAMQEPEKPENPKKPEKPEKHEKPSQSEIKKPSKKPSSPMIDKVSSMKHSKSETQIQSFSGSSPEFQAKRSIFETSTPPRHLSKPASPLSKQPDQIKKSESKPNLASQDNSNPPPKIDQTIDQSSRQPSLDFVDAYDKMVVDKAVIEAAPTSTQIFVDAAAQKSPTKNVAKENAVLLPDFIQSQVDKAMEEPAIDTKIESNGKAEMETERSFPEAMKIENNGKAKVETESTIQDVMTKTESNIIISEKTENNR